MIGAGRPAGDVSATSLKGSYGSANVAGSTSQLMGSVTGAAVSLQGATPAGSTTTAFVQTGEAYAAPAPGTSQTFQINGKDVTVGAGATIDQALSSIQNAGIAGVTATIDTGKLVLTSSSSIAITGNNTVFGAATATGGVSTPVDAVEGTLGSKAEININGSNVTFAGTEDMAGIAAAINTANTADKFGVTASVTTDGRLKLDSADGKAIKLGNGTGDAANGGAGALAKLGLTPGTTQASLNKATSINLNGTDVKFSAGSSMADIVSSINSASTGVTASINKDDGTLKLFSTGNINIADGSAGTGLAALGLTTAPASTTSIQTQSSVADLSILKADDAQKPIQALSGAIAQIDTQRAALGAIS